MSIKCSDIKLRDHIISNERACKVALISNQNEQIELKLLDIFTFDTSVVKYSSNDILQIPNITKSDYQLIDISNNGMVLLMNEDGSTLEIKFPQGHLGNEILDVMDSDKHMVCTLLKACNEIAICSTKCVVNVMKGVQNHFSNMWAKIDEFRKNHDMENNNENKIHIQTLITRDTEMIDQIENTNKNENNNTKNENTNQNQNSLESLNKIETEKSDLLLDIKILKSRMNKAENENQKSRNQHISHKQNIMELRRQNMKRNIIIRGRHVPQEKNNLLRNYQKLMKDKFNVHVPYNEISQIHHLPPIKPKGPKRIICSFKTLIPGSPFHEILKRSDFEKKLIAQKRWNDVRNPKLQITAEIQSSYDDITLIIAAKILTKMGKIKSHKMNFMSGKIELIFPSNKIKSVSNEQELFELFDDKTVNELLAKDETGRLGKDHLECM